MTLENVNFDNNSAFKHCNGINISGNERGLDKKKAFPYEVDGNNIGDYQLIVRNCTFSNNRGYATFGEFGGYCMKIIWASNANVLMDIFRFESNTLEMGGAVISLGYCDTVVRNCEVRNNEVTEIGASSAFSISGEG